MSRLYLLDTNVFSAWVDVRHARHVAVVDRVAALGESYIFLSTVTVSEVEFGLALPHSLDIAMVAAIRQGLNRFQVLELDRHVGEPYGVIRAWLVAHYGPKDRRRKLRSLSDLADQATDRELGIEENDLWLASQAIATDAILLTGDRMNRIVDAATATQRSLRIERW